MTATKIPYDVLYVCPNCDREGIALGIPREDIETNEDNERSLKNDCVLFCYNCSEKVGNNDVKAIHERMGRIVF
jgi:hypothetical protein